jgi:hypothetical protein
MAAAAGRQSKGGIIMQSFITAVAPAIGAILPGGRAPAISWQNSAQYLPCQLHNRHKQRQHHHFSTSSVLRCALSMMLSMADVAVASTTHLG